MPSGAAPGGAGRAVFEQNPFPCELGPDAVGFGEVAFLLRSGAGDDEAFDPIIPLALEPLRRRVL